MRLLHTLTSRITQGFVSLDYVTSINLHRPFCNCTQGIGTHRLSLWGEASAGSRSWNHSGLSCLDSLYDIASGASFCAPGQPASYSVCTGVLSQVYIGQGVNLASNLHTVPRLRLSGAIPLVPLYAFMWWAVTFPSTVVL